ncbi:MAG: hypothetical protein AB7E96_11690 [Deferribacterales bacterium]
MNETHRIIHERLEALKGGEQLNWIELCFLLQQIRDSRYWHGQAVSISHWFRDNREIFNKPASALWRILSSGKYVGELREKLLKYEIEIPTLEKLNPKISPESIEILSKLERVLKEDMFIPLAQRVFNDDIPRAELRKIWTTYRPILGGQTARGQFSFANRIPKANYEDRKQQILFDESVAIEFMQNHFNEIIKCERPQIIQFQDRLTPDDINGEKHMFTGVVLVKPVKGSIVYHGFLFYTYELVYRFRTSVYEELYCNYLWLLIQPKPDEPNFYENLFRDLPYYMGVLEINGTDFRLMREAVQCPKKPEKQEFLMSAFLERTLKK